MSLVALAVGAVAVIGGIVWAALALASLGPKPVDARYAVTVGDPKAPVVVDIFQDYICPFCGVSERANAADLTALTNSGTALVRIHPLNFFDDASLGAKYSTRAANALVSVAKAEPDRILAFNAALYTDQPAENTAGLTDTQIAARATAAGVSQATIDTFTQGSYVDFVNFGSQSAWNAGLRRTPTILINGTKFDGNTYIAGPLRQAIEDAAAKR